MAVKKLDIRPNPKKVKRLIVKPTRKVNGFDAVNNARDDYPDKPELRPVANEDVIEITLIGDGLTMLIRPINAMEAQISYENPSGPIFEEEIYNFLWKCEKSGWRFWDSKFSDTVLIEWKKITSDL